MAYGAYSRGLALLGIREGGAYFSGGGGSRGGADTTSAGPSWSNKDDYGSSSIAARNSRILAGQQSDKTRDAYERDVRKNVTERMQGDSQTPLTDAERSERDQQVKDVMEQYDKDPEKQKQAYDKYRPDLSSNERNNRARNEERQREAIRDGLKDMARESDKSGKEQSQTNFSSGAEGFGTDDFISDRAREMERNPDYDSESEADTASKAAENRAEAETSPGSSMQEQLIQLIQAFNTHINIPDAHHTPYYA